MSQARLAEQVGVTYQQLQKYETGVNKVSVNRLHALCKALGVEPVYFFDLELGADDANLSGDTHSSPSEDECKRLLAAFRQIRTVPLRRSIIAMIEAACRSEPPPVPRREPSRRVTLEL